MIGYWDRTNQSVVSLLQTYTTQDKTDGTRWSLSVKTSHHGRAFYNSSTLTCSFKGLISFFFRANQHYKLLLYVIISNETILNLIIYGGEKIASLLVIFYASFITKFKNFVLYIKRYTYHTLVQCTIFFFFWKIDWKL